MDALSWFVVAFVAQSVGIIALWIQVLRNDRYARSMGEFLEMFAQATIKHIHELLSDKYSLSFANGGDQNNNSIPEVPICLELGIELLDGLGDKIQSSSWLLK